MAPVTDIPSLALRVSSGWSRELVRRWVGRAHRKGLHNTGTLLQSFKHFAQASGATVEAGVTFSHHGAFADWGVGRGRPLRDGGRYTKRKRYRFYTPTIGREAQALPDLLAYAYAKAARELVETDLKSLGQ